jgi:hypothetical protein
VFAPTSQAVAARQKDAVTPEILTLTFPLSIRPLVGVKEAIGLDGAGRPTGRADVSRGANKTHGRTGIIGAMRDTSN